MKTADILLRIDELRGEHGPTDRALSLAAGGSADLIRNWRRGTSSPNTQSLAKIAAALGVSLDDLLSERAAPLSTEILRLVEMLSEEHRRQLVGYGQALLAQQDQTATPTTSGGPESPDRS